ncbi:hypothetical protein AVEN_42176-1 [Araneus ventricosus]|uniref:Uncharacterized protein n=1 Tax=Araneus ventricosus TaxID=182803 RepID=A0A4Y2AYD0_ARAVE|nr:hypothetical protein AVEN_42176-1 [Araneus ventricosus]
MNSCGICRGLRCQNCRRCCLCALEAVCSRQFVHSSIAAARRALRPNNFTWVMWVRRSRLKPGSKRTSYSFLASEREVQPEASTLSSKSTNGLGKGYF